MQNATMWNQNCNNNINSLQSAVENLKTAMKEMIAEKMDTQSDTDPMANLNDL